MSNDPRALDGVTLVDVHVSHGGVDLVMSAPVGKEADAAEALRTLVSGALHLVRNPFVGTRMEQPPTDANGMPVEPSR